MRTFFSLSRRTPSSPASSLLSSLTSNFLRPVNSPRGCFGASGALGASGLLPASLMCLNTALRSLTPKSSDTSNPSNSVKSGRSDEMLLTKSWMSLITSALNLTSSAGAGGAGFSSSAFSSFSGFSSSVFSSFQALPAFLLLPFLPFQA